MEESKDVSVGENGVRHVLEIVKTEGMATSSDDFELDIIIHGGHDFRNLVEYLRQGTKRATFIFGSDSFEFIRRNEANSIINIFRVKRWNILRYVFRCETAKSVCVTLPMEEMRMQTKNISKKDSLEIRRNHGDTKFYFGSGPDVGTNFGFVEPLIYEPVIQFEIPQYKDKKEHEPDARMRGSEFAETCRAIHSAKTPVTVNRYKEGLEFITGTTAMTSGRLKYIGTEREQNSRPNLEMSIPPETMTVLGKIGSIAGGNMVKIFFQESLPLKIVVRVGSIGVLRAYIENKSTTEQHSKKKG